jgi:hypothetical protein
MIEQEADYEPLSWSAPIHEKFLNITKQKHPRARVIVEQLEKGNDSRARRFSEQLVRWQLQNGAPVYAAKSLCSLAQEARRFGNTSLQLEWVQRATQIAPEDAWAHGQAGDAYFSMFRFNEATVSTRPPAVGVWAIVAKLVKQKSSQRLATSRTR